MIRMKEPSLVINSNDVPGPLYKMWQTVDADPGANVYSLVSYISEAQRVSLETFGYRLVNIVINSHGGPGALYLGGLDYWAIQKVDLSYLAPLKRSTSSGTIWVVACKIAAEPAGKDFCQLLAMTTGYQVVAGTINQYVSFGDGYKMLYIKNTIDEYGGDVFGFYASGTFRQIDVYTIFD